MYFPEFVFLLHLLPHPCVKDRWQLLSGIIATRRSGETRCEAETNARPRGRRGGLVLVGLQKREHPLPSLVPPLRRADDRGRPQQLQQLPRQVPHPHCSAPTTGKPCLSQKSFLTLPHILLPSYPVCRLTPCLALADRCVSRFSPAHCPVSQKYIPSCLRDIIRIQSEGYACCEGKGAKQLP